MISAAMTESTTRYCWWDMEQVSVTIVLSVAIKDKMLKCSTLPYMGTSIGWYYNKRKELDKIFLIKLLPMSCSGWI